MRGILMIEPLYHQVVKELKTQTRRSGGLDEVNEKPDNWEITGHTGDDNEIEVIDFCDYRDTLRNIYLKPRYKIGEVLYVKEPHIGKNGHYSYQFDLKADSLLRRCIGENTRWKNKMFMPASAARLFVQITGIRCERLLDISDKDCIAEGIEHDPMDGVRYVDYQNAQKVCNAKESFLSLYRFANKLNSKKEIKNLWVWVYDFKKVEKPSA